MDKRNPIPKPLPKSWIFVPGCFHSYTMFISKVTSPFIGHISKSGTPLNGQSSSMFKLTATHQPPNKPRIQHWLTEKTGNSRPSKAQIAKKTKQGRRRDLLRKIHGTLSAIQGLGWLEIQGIFSTDPVERNPTKSHHESNSFEPGHMGIFYLKSLPASGNVSIGFCCFFLVTFCGWFCLSSFFDG